MQAINRPFAQIINGSTQFVIPVFQRDYRWEEPQCRQLWRDVLRAADRPDRGHFLGSMVYIATGDSAAGFTRWLLIDGQQRLTTLTLLLAALRDRIRETKWKGGDESPTAPRIDAYFLQNTLEEGARKHKLVLRRRDNDTLASIISGEERSGEMSPRIVDAYEVFKELVAQEDPDKVYTGINKLQIVDVVLHHQHDDPQLVFESLNSTGVDLSQSDLIRNFILMRLPEKEQSELYASHWSKIESLFHGSEGAFDSFLRDYIALKTSANRQVKSDGIYANFRLLWDNLLAEGHSTQAVLDDMLVKARCHAAFSLGRTPPGKIHDAMASLRRLVDVPAILVMRLHECHEHARTLSIDQLVTALRLMESYVIRRAVCREQTRGYWQIFATLAYSVDNVSPFDSLLSGLALQRDTYRFPSDEAFVTALTTTDIYTLRVCKPLLDRLENFGSREPSPVDTYSVEHVMPQTENLPGEWRSMIGDNWREVHATWLHRLGNLTLTAYNAYYNARPFEEKKAIEGGFTYSSVRLNKSIREAAKWTAVEMEARGNDLAARALEVWPALNVPETVLREAKARQLRDKVTADQAPPIEMTDTVQPLFERLDAEVKALSADIISLRHRASVSYHAPEFFLEILPRKRYLTVILRTEYSELDGPPDIAGDTADWAFIVHAQYSGGSYLNIRRMADIDDAAPLIKRAFMEALS